MAITTTATATSADHDHVCERDHESLQIELLHSCNNTITVPSNSQTISSSSSQNHFLHPISLMNIVFGAKKNQSFNNPRKDTIISPQSDDPDHHATPTSISTTITSSEKLEYILLDINKTVKHPSNESVSNPYCSTLDTIVAASVVGNSTTNHHDELEHRLEVGEVVQAPVTTTLETIVMVSNIVKEKNLESLHKHKGVDGIAAILDTNLNTGISSETNDLRRRQDEYGSNTYGESTSAPSESFFQFVHKASIEWQNILLFWGACLSLLLTGVKYGLENGGWYEEAVLFITIFLLVVGTSYRNYLDSRNELLLPNLFINHNTLEIEVLRDRILQTIVISDIVVGDIVVLKIGDWVPADGLFVNGENLKLDDDIDGLHGDDDHDPSVEHENDPIIFLCCGRKVIEGSANMLVTSVGKSTGWGEMMSEVKQDPRKLDRLLKVRVDKLNTCIQMIRFSTTIIILLVLLLRFFLGKNDDDTGEQDEIGELMKVLERLVAKPKAIIGVTTTMAVLMVGAQEGMPLIINCSFFYWNKKMVNNHHVIIHESYGCVTMGSVTTILIDKTEGLLLNRMEVDMFWTGELEAISSGDIVSVISQEVREAICYGVGAAVLAYDSPSRPIENPILLQVLLPWTEMNFGMNMEALKQRQSVLISRSSDKERSATLMKKNGDAENTSHLHWNGSAETILPMCSQYYSSNGMINDMDEVKIAAFQEVVQGMATNGLQSIAFAYRLIEEEDSDIKDYARKLYQDGLILLGIVGLKYPCCPEEKRAVDAFRNAGVRIKLASPESLSMVKTTAIECGMLRPNEDLNGIVLEGEDFRNFSKEERMEKVDQIIVMGNASPSDKLLFVQCLKQKGEVVAVTGTRIRDSPSLKEADVGIFIGTKNSEMAKESSDIIIPKGRLASMVIVTLFGRCSYRNSQKFIQFELIINFSWLLITFSTMTILGKTLIPILQFFFVHMVVSTLAALALLTEPPTKELSEMRIVTENESLITKAMWRNIILQVSYQVVVLLIFQFMGQALLSAGGLTNLNKHKQAMIFNGFVLCQVFNQFIARESEKKNVFKGILGNYLFLVSIGVPIILQVIVMLFATRLTVVPRMSWVQWLACVIFAIMPWPIDYVGKCISGFLAKRSTA